MVFFAILLMFALPWLDKSPVRSGRYRPLFKIAFWLFVIDCFILGYLGAMPAEEPYVSISRVATAYYFIHLLILLPVIAKIEKPLPLPDSIDEATRGKG
jgi:ubiquinol-cytochrome c reductase cytochrome b subunit